MTQEHRIPSAYRIRMRFHKDGILVDDGFLATDLKHVDDYSHGFQGEPYVLVGRRSKRGEWHAQGMLFSSREEAVQCRKAIRKVVRKIGPKPRMCIVPYY